LKEDINVIKEIRNGKKNEFAWIVKKYEDRLYSFVLRMVQNEEDALDLTQESFIKAFKGLDKYDERYSFKNWIFTIASHHTIDFLRKKGKIKEIQLLEKDVSKPYISHIDRFIGDERMRRLSREIELLPENYRMAILLKHKEDLKIEDISQIMKIPVGTVKIWLHRARKQLKKRMESYNED